MLLLEYGWKIKKFWQNCLVWQGFKLGSSWWQFSILTTTPASHAVNLAQKLLTYLKNKNNQYFWSFPTPWSCNLIASEYFHKHIILKCSYNFRFNHITAFAIMCQKCEPSMKIPKPDCLRKPTFLSFRQCPQGTEACYKRETSKMK